MDQIEQLMDKIAERKLYLNDKNLEQSIWILLDNLNLLKFENCNFKLNTFEN